MVHQKQPAVCKSLNMLMGHMSNSNNNTTLKAKQPLPASRLSNIIVNGSDTAFDIRNTLNPEAEKEVGSPSLLNFRLPPSINQKKT